MSLRRLSAETAARLGQAPSALVTFVGQIPTTNTRILATLGMAYITTVRYVTSDTWAPSWEWLLFLAGMAGLDTLQFFGKRTTDADYVKARQGTGASAEPPA